LAASIITEKTAGYKSFDAEKKKLYNHESVIPKEKRKET